MAISTYKVFLMKSTDGITFEKLIDIKDFPDLGGAPEMLETTTLSDSMQTYIPGIQSLDALEFTANYTKDDFDSLKELEGTEYTYTVIKKHTSHSGKRGTSYWLTINKDNGEKMSVKSYVYDEYDVNDRITLVRHVGTLGIEYYEYIENIK